MFGSLWTKGRKELNLKLAFFADIDFFFSIGMLIANVFILISHKYACMAMLL